MEDIISSLPRNINEHILYWMPLEDAIRTSILSSTWKDMWASRPAICFTRLFFIKNFREKNLSQKTFVDAVHNIVSVHVGPIRTFKFYVPPLREYDYNMPDMDLLMHRVLRNHAAIERFTLDESTLNRPYKLPCRLFDCSQLVVLSLSNCLLEPPQGFRGFHNLKTLELARISLSANAFEVLLPSARFLKSLCLSDCTGTANLKADAPCLRKLHLKFSSKNPGFVIGIFASTPSLQDVMLTGMNTVYKGNAADLTKLLANMRKVRSLKLSCSIFKFLASNTTPDPVPLQKLMNLEMHAIQFKDLDHTSTVLCIIRNSPKLKNLSVTFSQRETIAAAVEAQVIEYLEQPNCLERSLCQLETVEITVPNLMVSGVMVFIKLLLAKTPLLENMMVQVRRSAETSNLFKKIKGFHRASMHCRIALFEIETSS